MALDYLMGFVLAHAPGRVAVLLVVLESNSYSLPAEERLGTREVTVEMLPVGKSDIATIKYDRILGEICGR